METREETPLDKARREFANRNGGKSMAEMEKEKAKKDAAEPAPEKATPEQAPEQKKAAPRKRKTLEEREKELAEKRDALNKELAELRAEKGKKERRERNHLLILFGSYFEDMIKNVAKWENREKNDAEVKKLAEQIKAKVSP